MPLVKTDKLGFLHFPRTGGTWVSRVLEKAVPSAFCYEESGHCGYNKAKASYGFGDKFIFTFIRFPVHWYRSYWGRRMRLGWTPCPFDSTTESSDFNEFIDKVIKGMPNYLDELWREFLGQEYNSPNYIGKYKTLREDLIKVLELSGETFDRKIVEEFPPEGVITWNDKCDMTEETYNRIVGHHREFIERFNYPKDLDKELLITGSSEEDCGG